jgi:hypothetical protein
MKTYQCYKKVRADEIVRFEDAKGLDKRVHLKDGNFWDASPSWMAKNKPEIGGYLVEYSDGYTSYSPKKAFEEGYELFDRKNTFEGILEPKLYGEPVDVPMLASRDVKGSVTVSVMSYGDIIKFSVDGNHLKRLE